MIRLNTPGVRAGTFTVELTVWDLLSLQEALTTASIHLTQRLDELTADIRDDEMRRLLENKLKDVNANYNELEAVLDKRNKLVDQEEGL